MGRAKEHTHPSGLPSAHTAQVLAKHRAQVQANHLAKDDSTCVKLLADAGAVIGKTQLHEFAYGVITSPR